MRIAFFWPRFVQVGWLFFISEVRIFGFDGNGNVAVAKNGRTDIDAKHKDDDDDDDGRSFVVVRCSSFRCNKRIRKYRRGIIGHCEIKKKKSIVCFGLWVVVISSIESQTTGGRGSIAFPRSSFLTTLFLFLRNAETFSRNESP